MHVRAQEDPSHSQSKAVSPGRLIDAGFVEFLAVIAAGQFAAALDF